MEWHVREVVFSVPRTRRYLQEYHGDTQRAAAAYDQNILLAQALMPALQTVEIALRNAIDGALAKQHQRADWWAALPGDEFAWLQNKVNEATRLIRSRRERVTPDKVVAELTFGSWTRLFNNEHARTLWSALTKAFPACPKRTRQRKPIASALNHIRGLRNRVMHHEPLLWLMPDVAEIHTHIILVLDWIDPSIGLWLERHDTLGERWSECANL